MLGGNFLHKLDVSFFEQSLRPITWCWYWQHHAGQ